MTLIAPPEQTVGCSWYFFEHPDRAPAGSNAEQAQLIAFAGLRGEVNNGGFDQWLLNGAGDMAMSALNFVRAINHFALVEVLAEVLDRFSSPYPADPGLRRQQLLAFQGEWDQDVTNWYYEIEESENLDDLMDRFVEMRWQSFFRTVT